MIRNIFTFCKNSQGVCLPKQLASKTCLYQFGKQKKEKIIKLKKHTETLEDQLLKQKKEDVKVFQNNVVEKNKKVINSMPFDELTMRMKQENIALKQFQANTNNNNNATSSSSSQTSTINQQKQQSSIHSNEQPNQKSDKNKDGTIFNPSELKILLTDSGQFLNFDNLEFPWDFQGVNKAQKEQNLKSAIEITKIINENTAIQLYKAFLTSIEEFDYEQLGELVERKFLRELNKRLQAMQQQKMQLKFDNIRTKQISVDLFKVENTFAVGVEQNRRKNHGSSAYVIFDDFIGQEIPAKHIVKRRVEPKEIARIYVQLHLNFESDISLSIIDNNNHKTKSDSISNIPKDSDNSNKQNNNNNKSFHTMILEKVIVECDYKSMRNKSLSMQNSDESVLKNTNDYINVANMKNYASADNFKIIDFDGFMKGNPLIVETIDQD